MNFKAVALLLLGVALAAPAQAQFAVSGSNSESGAAAQSAAGSVAGAGASVVITNGAIPANTTHKQDLNYTGSYEVKGVPNVIVPNILPSAVCHGTSSAGVAVLGLGLGGGSSWQDADCQFRETARVFQGLGMTQDAVAVLCSSGFAANAPTCKNLAPKKAVAQAPQPVADTGTKIGEPGQPGGGDRVRADAEFCSRPEVQDDAMLSARNGCVVKAAFIKRGPR